MFPLNIRGLGNSLGSTINWTANAIVSLTFPALLTGFGTGTLFLGYAAACVLGVLFVKYYVFETRNRTLEEIEDYLRHRAHKSKIAA